MGHVNNYKESEMVNRWIWQNHRDSLQWRRVRLGPVPTHEMARAYAVILRWADAIFIENGEVNIVEAKLRPEPGACGQLEMYKDLFRNTPEFSVYKSWHINMILLTPIYDLNMVEFCSKKGIRYEVFQDIPLSTLTK